MSGMNSQFATHLMRRQGDETDDVFAKRLGISRTYWAHIRAGRRRPSLRVIRAALAAFPELAPFHLLDMQGTGAKRGAA